MQKLINFWNTHPGQRPVVIYCLGALLVLLVQFILLLGFGDFTWDIDWHDTYFIMAYPVVFRSVIIAFLFFAFVSYLIARIPGRSLNNALVYIHFWITLLGVSVIFFPQHYHAQAGQPRHYYDYSTFQQVQDYFKLQRWLTLAICTVCLAQFLFIGNVIYALLKRKSSHE